MKRFATALTAGVCVLVGVMRWLDLVNYTDLATGFTRWGSPLVRYGVFAAVLGVIFLCSLLQVDDIPPLGRHRLDQGVLCILAGILFVGAAAAGGYGALLGASARVRGFSAVLFVVTGGWMVALGASITAKTPFLQNKSALWGVAGTLSFLLLSVLRYALRPSGIVRVGVTLQLIDAMFQMLFAVSLVRAACLVGQKNGKRCFLLGFVVFFTGTCLELPQAVCLWLAGQGSLGDMLIGIALGAMGLVGLGCAWAVAAPVPSRSEESLPDIQKTL